MKIIDELHKINEKFSLVIGNFDGVHLGHQKMLSEFITESKKEGVKTCILTFTPHPALIFDPSKKHFLLQTPDEKKEKISKSKIDYYCELKFNKEIASLDGETFFKKFILESKNLMAVFPGHDFCLGAGRKFDIDDLKNLVEDQNIKLHKLKKYSSFDERTSSTQIRNLITLGEIAKANVLLGEEFKLTGEIIHGLKNGRKINFPTINLKIDENKILPKTGVYKTLVHRDGEVLKALTNIGRKPTVGDFSLSIETFILDFNREIYGEEIEISFLDFIREEKKFNSFEDLKKQIALDREMAWT